MTSICSVRTSRSAQREVGAEPFVLGEVPAHADGHPQSAAAQDVDRRVLLGGERRLALRQDQHARDELDALCHRGKLLNNTKISWNVLSAV